MKKVLSLMACLVVMVSAAPAVSAHGCGGHHGGYGRHYSQTYAPCSHSWCSNWTTSSTYYEFPETQAPVSSSCCWMVENQTAVCYSCGQTLTRTVRQEQNHQWCLDENGNSTCAYCTPHFTARHIHDSHCGMYCAN